MEATSPSSAPSAATGAIISGSGEEVIEKDDESFSVKFAKVVLGTFSGSLLGLGVGALIVYCQSDKDYSIIPSFTLIGTYWSLIISLSHIKPSC